MAINFKKSKLQSRFLIALIIFITILGIYFSLRLIEPNRATFTKCLAKVAGWSDDCYKTCKPYSDNFVKCQNLDCSNKQSLLLNYCNERCRAFTEAENNKCGQEFEDKNLIRRFLKVINL